MFKIRFTSLRTRLMLAYVGLIILGFGGLVAITGRQLAEAARRDYETQTTNEIHLASRGIQHALESYYRGQITSAELDELISDYEQETDATLLMFLPAEADPLDNFEHGRVLTHDIEELQEFEDAQHADSKLIKRTDADGEEAYYIAMPMISRQGNLGYVQLREPASNLQRSINAGWAILTIGVGVMTLLSVLASIYLSVSLIRPLETLQESAWQLAERNLDYRVPPLETDELNAVGEAFNTMADQLQAMLEEQRAFASNTSHELRTPLTTMRLRTEALRFDTTLDETTRTDYIREIDEELVRMSSLVEDLILLSRFDAGRAQMGTDQFDFLRFAENLHRTLRAEAAAKQIDFRLELPNPAPASEMRVQASLNHVSILFRNLLENALKYTPHGGKITWQIRVEDGAIVSVIQDNGQGIVPESLPHVFDRFFRGDKAHSRTISGTGLGLALVKAIADVYGATLSITSGGVDQGTTATVRWKLF